MRRVAPALLAPALAALALLAIAVPASATESTPDPSAQGALAVLALIPARFDAADLTHNGPSAARLRSESSVLAAATAIDPALRPAAGATRHLQRTLGPTRVRDIAEQAKQLIERSHGNLLAVWLLYIDSKNSPRRNPPPGTAGMICATCSGADSTYPLSCIER